MLELSKDNSLISELPSTVSLSKALSVCAFNGLTPVRLLRNRGKIICYEGGIKTPLYFPLTPVMVFHTWTKEYSHVEYVENLNQYLNEHGIAFDKHVMAFVKKF